MDFNKKLYDLAHSYNEAEASLPVVGGALVKMNELACHVTGPVLPSTCAAVHDVEAGLTPPLTPIVEQSGKGEQAR